MSKGPPRALVQSLRNGDAKARGFRQMQVKAAIRFCEVLFGQDYAALMSRAAENAAGRAQAAARGLRLTAWGCTISQRGASNAKSRTDPRVCDDSRQTRGHQILIYRTFSPAGRWRKCQLRASAVSGVKRPIGASRADPRRPGTLDDAVVRVRDDDRRGDIRRAVAARAAARGAPSGGTETAVYKDQLDEVGRDVAAGLIGAAEAEAARVEIGRRLLAAAEQLPPRRRRTSVGAAALAVLALVGAAARRARVLSAARLAAARRISASAQPRPRRHRSRWKSWWRRSKRISTKTPPMAAAGPCWRRCCSSSAASTKRCGPTAIPSHIPVIPPSAAPISARLMAAAANGVVTADAKSEFDRALALDAGDQGALLSRACRRAGWPA